MRRCSFLLLQMARRRRTLCLQQMVSGSRGMFLKEMLLCRGMFTRLQGSGVVITRRLRWFRRRRRLGRSQRDRRE